MTSFAQRHRENIYDQIQMRPLSLSLREIAGFFDQSRFDPRLMEIMTEFIRDFWWTLDAEDLHHVAQRAQFPFMMKAAAVLILHHCKILLEDRLQFIEWFETLVRGIQDPAPQLMYIGILPIGSKAIQREVKEALPEMMKHHLILKDLPFNKGKPGVLKSEKNLPLNRVDELDLLKLKYVREIKLLKKKYELKNEELIQASGINRVFLSRVLNNKIEGISIEYLKARMTQLEISLRRIYPTS